MPAPGPTHDRSVVLPAVLTALTAAATGTAIAAPVVSGSWPTAVLHSFGTLLVLAGLVVSVTSRRPRIGLLMICGGGAYHLGDLRASDNPWLFAVGCCLAYLWTSVLTHLALALPEGRVTGAVPRILVAGSYLASVGTQVGWFVAEDPQPPLWWTIRPPGASTWSTVSSLTFTAWTIAVLVVVARRWLTSTPLRRLAVGPVWAAILMAGAAAVAVPVAAMLSAPTGVHTAVLTATLAVELLVIPLFVVARRIRLSLAQANAARALLQLEHSGADRPGPSELESTLARAVGDPTLRIGYPRADNSCSDVPGQSVTAGDAPAGRTVTPLHRNGTVIAWIEHDDELADHRELAAAAFGLAALAIENHRLYQAQQAQSEQLHRSRRQVVAAAFAERQRIQRDLHDGTQQQLYTALLMLDTLRDLTAPIANRPLAVAVAAGIAPGAADAEPAPPDCAAPGPAARSDVVRRTAERAHRVLLDAITGLRQLTQGIYPAALADHGLAGTIGQLAETAPVPVEVRIPAQRWPPQLELTVFFLVAEALTNAYRHAAPNRITVTVRSTGERLHVEIDDDGRGGATPRPGSGLNGLRDRVDAAGGTLTIDSPPGGGTRLAAHFELPGTP